MRALFACVVLTACGAPHARSPVGQSVEGEPHAATSRAPLPVATHGCSGSQPRVGAVPPTSSCVIAADDAVVHEVLVHTSDGEAVLVNTFGGRARIHVRGAGSEARVEGVSPIEFSGSLARPPVVRLRRALPVAGIATLREGVQVEGSASGAELVGRVMLGPLVEFGPVTIPCKELRLSTQKDARSDASRDNPVLPSRSPGVLTTLEPVVLFPSATSDDGVRATVHSPLERLATKGPRTEIRVRTQHGSELRGWVPSELVRATDGAGFGAGAGVMCGCGPRPDARPTVRVLPGTGVHARPGGAAWGLVREAMIASVYTQAGEWLQLLTTAHYSEGDCAGEALEHFWVQRTGTAELRAN